MASTASFACSPSTAHEPLVQMSQPGLDLDDMGWMQLDELRGNPGRHDRWTQARSVDPHVPHMDSPSSSLCGNGLKLCQLLCVAVGLVKHSVHIWSMCCDRCTSCSCLVEQMVQVVSRMRLVFQHLPAV